LLFRNILNCRDLAILNLSQLKIGQKAVILSFTDDDLALKLMEMGCIPGEVISLERIAPMGDPIAISVSGYTLSLRLKEAETIQLSIY
jgi:ferrous iron transport protein A